MLDLNDDGRLDDADASKDLEQTGIAGEVELKLSTPEGTAPDPGNPAPPALPVLQCSVGAEALPLCVSAPLLMRTFWRRMPPQ